MLRTFLLLTCLGLAGLIVVDFAHRPPAAAAVPRRPLRAIVRATPTPPVPPAPSVPQIMPAMPASGPGVTPTPALDMMARLAVRRRLAREGDQVYLDSLLVHTDSVLARWVDRTTLTVALVADTAMVGWSPALLNDARAGMRAWDDNAAGMSFREVASPDSADITVRWVHGLPDSGEAGLTTLSWTADGVAHSAAIQLALDVGDSIALPAAVRMRVAAHEFGHALGLPHSADPDDLMYRTSPVEQPSARDQATLRLLYAVAPGPLRIPEQF